MHSTLAFIPGLGGIGMSEMLIVGVIALLLFGKRLPEVARSLGKGIVEFKKGISGIETEVDRAVYTSPSSSASRPVPHDDRDEISAPKFEPPASEPADAEARHA
ncbi:MAG: twin-arginine translocase TatA/TatE family subunit [Planctomycetales bacterium]